MTWINRRMRARRELLLLVVRDKKEDFPNLDEQRGSEDAL
jgi:hypothetical protein